MSLKHTLFCLQGITAAQVAETQAKVDFEQVRMMLFPDPITPVSSPASQQPLGQQVLQQPVQQSQEQLTGKRHWAVTLQCQVHLLPELMLIPTTELLSSPGR